MATPAINDDKEELKDTSAASSQIEMVKRQFPMTWYVYVATYKVDLALTASSQTYDLSRRTFVPFDGPKAEDLPPPYPSVDAAEVTPLATANWISSLLFFWVAPIVTLGYRRVIRTYVNLL